MLLNLLILAVTIYTAVIVTMNAAKKLNWNKSEAVEGNNYMLNKEDDRSYLDRNGRNKLGNDAKYRQSMLTSEASYAFPSVQKSSALRTGLSDLEDGDYMMNPPILLSKSGLLTMEH
jgi:hypothetical protein